MATLVSALDVEFTPPAAAPFNVQATGGNASLLRKNTAGAAWALITSTLNGSAIVDNPVAGAVYKFTATGGAPIVQADQ
jgi:hypothetical protein